jgi:hypothetical protein
MRYIIGRLNPPFSLKAFLQNTKPSGVDLAAPATSIRALPSAAAVIASGKLSVKSFMKA